MFISEKNIQQYLTLHFGTVPDLRPECNHVLFIKIEKLSRHVYARKNGTSRYILLYQIKKHRR